MAIISALTASPPDETTIWPVLDTVVFDAVPPAKANSMATRPAPLPITTSPIDLPPLDVATKPPPATRPWCRGWC